VGRSHLVPTLAAGGMHYDLAGEDSAVSLQPLRHVDEHAERIWALFWLETLFELSNFDLEPDDRLQRRYAKFRRIGSHLF